MPEHVYPPGGASDFAARLVTRLAFGHEDLDPVEKTCNLFFAASDRSEMEGYIRDKARSRLAFAVPPLDDLLELFDLPDLARATVNQAIEPQCERLDLNGALRERFGGVHDTNSASASARSGSSGSRPKTGFPPAASMYSNASPRVVSVGFSICRASAISSTK